MKALLLLLIIVEEELCKTGEEDWLSDDSHKVETSSEQDSYY